MDNGVNKEIEMAKYKARSLSLCEKLLHELRENRDDADLFFGGDIHKAYVNATDTAVNEVINIRARIRNK